MHRGKRQQPTDTPDANFKSHDPGQPAETCRLLLITFLWACREHTVVTGVTEPLPSNSAVCILATISDPKFRSTELSDIIANGKSNMPVY
jgi:hypothetical protein